MKKFFTYKLSLCCGLPSVTLLGTEQDWIDITNRAKKLVDYDCKEGYMKIWYKMLEPILNKFIESIKGKPDLKWWNRCCTQLTSGSGPAYLSGWLTVFSVYDNDGRWVGDRTAIDDWRGKLKSEWPIIDSGDLAKGAVTVDLKIDDNGLMYDTVVTAGSSGYTCPDDFTVQPCVSWNIVDKTVRK